ncbi:MAG: hypothetical protein K2H38_07635 [Muribaculaceae bacterium]|nr:hypothetical protein [Muribaculaceae bacterium]
MTVRSKTLSFIIIIVAVFSIYPIWGRQSIVPEGLQEDKEFAFASRFLEHYRNLLLDAGSETAADTIRMVKEQGFRYLKGNDAALRSLKGDEEFSIDLNDGVYRTEWRRDGKPVVVCSFPSRVDLLTFSNKIQLEDRMIGMLKGKYAGKRSDRIPSISTSRLKKVEFSPFYVRDLGYYITPRLSHQVVYLPAEGSKDQCELLTDHSVYPLECVSNYMLTGFSPNPIDLSMDVSRYGYDKANVSITLDELYGKLSAEGSVPYWGVDEYDGKTVKGLYVWLNKPGGFAHVMTVNIPISGLSSSVKANAKMNCYVRLDNLKNLFEEFK